MVDASCYALPGFGAQQLRIQLYFAASWGHPRPFRPIRRMGHTHTHARHNIQHTHTHTHMAKKHSRTHGYPVLMVRRAMCAMRLLPVSLSVRPESSLRHRRHRRRRRRRRQDAIINISNSYISPRYTCVRARFGRLHSVLLLLRSVAVAAAAAARGFG